MSKWVPVGKYGLRYREHPERVKGIGKRKRPLRYYVAVYKWLGKVVTDAYGWEGEDFHNEDDIVETALSLRQNRKSMTPPFTLKELIGEREQALQAKAEKERQQTHLWTVERLWNEYRQQLSGADASKADLSRWNLYLQESFAHKEPRELEKLEIDRVRINLLKKLSPQTVKHVLALLRRIINFGVDGGLIAPLPFKITMPSVDNIKTEDLDHEQLQRLFDVLETTPYQTAANMMRLALFTGMRRGEMFKLQWADIDFHRGFIFIRGPKGGRSQKIPMSENVKELLQSIPATNKDYVFPARGGGPRKNIAKDINRIKAKAGLPADFRPLHGLRHVFASMLASSGQVDMFTLQKLLTHKSPEMTQRYAHYRDEAMQRAAGQVDDILFEALETARQKKVNQA